MVVTAQEVKLLTADDLLHLHSKGVRGELIRGVLCETTAAGGEHGETVVNPGYSTAKLRQAATTG